MLVSRLGLEKSLPGKKATEMKGLPPTRLVEISHQIIVAAKMISNQQKFARAEK